MLDDPSSMIASAWERYQATTAPFWKIGFQLPERPIAAYEKSARLAEGISCYGEQFMVKKRGHIESLRRVLASPYFVRSCGVTSMTLRATGAPTGPA